MTETDPTPVVTRNEDRSRYDIHVGDVLAGFTEVVYDGHGRAVFPHTEIDHAFSGRGYGGILVGAAMTDAAARGETVVPQCSFVARYLEKREVPGLDIHWPAVRDR